MRLNSVPSFTNIINNAALNAMKTPHGRCHDIVLTFVTFLFIWARPVTYEFLHKNMPEALRSISVVRIKIHTQNTVTKLTKCDITVLM